MKWWVRRYRANCCEATLRILCHSDASVARLRGILDDDVIVERTRHYSKLRALAEVAEGSSTDDLALLPVGFALAPSDLLSGMYAYHQSRGNACTVPRGLPADVAPCICKRELILSLAEIDLPGAPSHPAAAVERLLRLPPQMLADLPFAIQSCPYEPSSLQGAPLPRSVSVATPRDLEIFRAVVQRVEVDPCVSTGRHALDLWTEAVSAASRDRRRRLRQALPEYRRQSSDGRSLHILYVSCPSAFSGAEESLCQLVRKIDQHQFRLSALIGTEGYFSERLQESGVEVTRPNFDFSDDTVENLLYVLQTLRTINPAVIHTNALSGMPILHAATLLDIPVVHHVRNGALNGYGEYLANAAALVVISEFLEREVLSFGVAREKIHLIRDEVDPDDFHPGVFAKATARQAYGIPAEAKVALMIARFSPNKRHDLMLKAAKIIKEQIPTFRLVLKGEVYRDTQDIEQAEVVLNAIREYGLADCVTWLQFVPDIRVLQAAADVLVLCSDREGLGRCVVEAMAMGTPVVVTNSGGTHEIISDRKTGLVVKGDDPLGLAAYVLELFRNPQLARDLAVGAREYAKEHLTSAASAGQMMQIYRFVTDRSASPAWS
jgi:glycosyltransferase involved in cell wall biosynthesis